MYDSFKTVRMILTMEQKTKKCPYCGEEILIEAKKCKHCKEWLVSKHQPQKLDNHKRTDSDWDAEDFWDDIKGCLFWIVLVGGLIWAYNDKPSEEKITQAILEDVKDSIADQASITLGLLSEDDNNVLGGLASLFINGAGTELIEESFYKYNSISIKEHWFYSTGEIFNSDNPDGSTVALGICGFVIPFVGWNDFKLFNE